ncbi:DNA replication factor Dna2 [Ancylostoma caninum]|uniref:DNA replication ATP-dependent helicase/nuclease n=1 Tax=Ancylostoma caninum TaxID=29170 RepID=A0A368FTM7_ANCCA|nr:DNA replication factor Dna2 [Ancylostoma caninum]
MSNCQRKDVNVYPGLQKQELVSKKRPLCNNSIGNGGDLTALSPVKEIKKMKAEELTPIKRHSTPSKRSPKLDAVQTCSSDFSDWDDSPIKQAKGGTDIACAEVAEKENSEFEDSFDEPVHTMKRSTALRVFSDVGRSPVKNSESKDSLDENNSGVSGFPSLCDPSSEVELTVMSVKNEDGLVDLICRSDSGKEAVVYLQDQWADLPIEPNTRIRLIGAQPWGDSDWLVSSEQGILIVAPDTLVPSTAIARSTWCQRKVVLNERFRGQAQANKAMLIGVIMHELFQAALRCPNPRIVTTEWLLGKWQNGLYDEVITQLAALRFTPSQFETELAPYADVIVDWVQTHLPGGSSYISNSSTPSVSKVHDIEENIWIPQLGIKGKVDVTLKMHTTAKAQLRPLELKTGKSGQSSEHAAQVMLYSLMLSSRYKQPIGDSSLIYLKDGVTRDVRPRSLELKAIINQRNNLALYLSKLNPELLPEPREDPRFCERCDHATVCSFYQVAMEPAERASNLMHEFAKKNMDHLSATHLEYFKKWIRWIFSEWSEDEARRGSGVSDLWRMSPEDRESKGTCAAFVRLISHVDISSDTSSSYLLTFKSENEISQTNFAPGSMCAVSTSTSPALLLVPVVESSPNSITVRSDRMIDKDGVYHIDLYNSFSTYPTTLGSLLLLMGSDEFSTGQRELLIDLVPPSSVRSDIAALPYSVREILSNSGHSDELNDEQRKAVESALLCSDYTLIEGFPGSGKTTTMVTLLRCLLEMKCSVLLTANTHSALNNVLVKLRKYVDASKILRLGKSSSGRSDIAELTLEAKLSGVDDDKYKTARDILKNTPLVASTCHYVPRDLLFSWRKFDYCIVDEASMVSSYCWVNIASLSYTPFILQHFEVLEPVLLSALAAARRFVLVGDAHQLTPLVQNRKCAEEGMSVSLFERLQVHSGVLHSLVSQYRMNSVIAKLSSHLFYEDRLVCGSSSVAEACLSNSEFFKESSAEDPWKVIESGLLQDSVVFVDTRAREQADFAMINDGGGMVHNMGEARLVCDVVKRFLKNGVSPSDIGVMCVYRKQVDVIKSFLGPEISIEVNSVDQYQGRDKSVMIWSLVWTDTSGRRCELLRDRRRVNVALTRAKHKLILIGCAESMRSMDIMKRVVDSTITVEV